MSNQVVIALTIGATPLKPEIWLQSPASVFLIEDSWRSVFPRCTNIRPVDRIPIGLCTKCGGPNWAPRTHITSASATNGDRLSSPHKERSASQAQSCSSR